jgi:hypothetical protein
VAYERFGSTPDAVLLAILARVIAVVPEANEENVFITTDLDADPPPNPGLFCYAIFLRPNGFDDELIDGGGRDQLRYQGGVTVRIYSPVMLDELGRSTIALTNANVGLLQQSTKLMTALALFDPVDAEENYMISDAGIFPANMAGVPQPEPSITALDLNFNFEFDWIVPGISDN